MIFLSNPPFIHLKYKSPPDDFPAMLTDSQAATSTKQISELQR